MVSQAMTHLAIEEKQVTLTRHPLQTIYQLVKRNHQREQIPDLQKKLEAIPEKLRNAVYFEIWLQAADVDKKDSRWGERKALSDPFLLLNAIQSIANKILDQQSQETKNAIYGTIYRIAGQPLTPDLKWGERNAKKDTQYLIRALHRHQCLQMNGKTISIYAELEKGSTTPSCSYHLYRKELDRGQIRYHNGMITTFESAKQNAIRLSDDSAQGYNIHCSYAATNNLAKDLASALLEQGGVATPPVLQLLDGWQDFMEQSESERLLQVCNSRGAIEVYNALSHVPTEFQQRIIVIAIAPAAIIPAEAVYKVVNLMIASDNIMNFAANRHLINSPNTWIVDEHRDRTYPHSMQGSSYREQLQPLIHRYIHTNDI
jgi:hypothetical protein